MARFGIAVCAALGLVAAAVASRGAATFSARPAFEPGAEAPRSPTGFGPWAVNAEVRGRHASPWVATQGGVQSRAHGEVVEQAWRDGPRLYQVFHVPPGDAGVEIDVQLEGARVLGAAPGAAVLGTPEGRRLYSDATWIDARGARITVPVRAVEESRLAFVVPAELHARSPCPCLLDPVLGPEIDPDLEVQVPVAGTPQLAWNGDGWFLYSAGIFATPKLWVIGPDAQLLQRSSANLGTTSGTLVPAGARALLFTSDRSSTTFQDVVRVQSVERDGGVGALDVLVDAGSASSVAAHGGGFTVAWVDNQRDGGFSHWARRFDATGAELDAAPLLLAQGAGLAGSAVAHDGTGYFYLTVLPGEVRVEWRGDDGGAWGQVSTEPDRWLGLQAASGPERALFAVTLGLDGGFGRVLALALSSTQPAVRTVLALVDGGTNLPSPAAGAFGPDFVVAWNASRQGQVPVEAAVIRADGGVVPWTGALVASAPDVGGMLFPSAVAPGAGLVAVGGQGVFAGRLFPSIALTFAPLDGGPTPVPVHVETRPNREVLPEARASGDRVLVTWLDDRMSEPGQEVLYATVVDADGGATVAPFAPNGGVSARWNFSARRTAPVPGGWRVVANDAFTVRTFLLGFDGGVSPMVPLSTGTGIRNNEHLDSAGGAAVVAWADFGSTDAVRVVRFAPDGGRLDSPHLTLVQAPSGGYCSLSGLATDGRDGLVLFYVYPSSGAPVTYTLARVPLDGGPPVLEPLWTVPQGGLRCSPQLTCARGDCLLAWAAQDAGQEFRFLDGGRRPAPQLGDAGLDACHGLMSDGERLLLVGDLGLAQTLHADGALADRAWQLPGVATSSTAVNSARALAAYMAPGDGGFTGQVWLRTLTFGLAGASCTVGSACESGFCVDGVCCDSACGGGVPSDCQACAVAAGAATDGVCGPSRAGLLCRPAALDCDVAEACDGVDLACPPDGPSSCGPDGGASGGGGGAGGGGGSGSAAVLHVGCGCAASGSGWLLALAALAVRALVAPFRRR